jgi:hypothetical protein
MNPSVATLLARIDSGEITPANARDAIDRAGGLAFIILNLLIP